MLLRDLRLDFLIGDDAAFFHVDQQHAARLKTPLPDDLFFIDRQDACFRSQNDEIVFRHDIACRPQAVAVQHRADLAAIGEGDSGRAIPRLHECCMIFVERAALIRHQLVARPCFRDQHHHGMCKAVAALMQEFERIVETGRIRLALIGNWPELGNIVAEQFAIDRSLARRHPVDIAAQRVDFAVMGDHAVGVGKTPGRKGVGGKTLVHQRHRAFKAGVFQVQIISADLIGQEHALIDHRAGRHGHDIETLIVAVILLIDAVGDDLAQHEQAALEIVVGFQHRAAPDEDLHMERLGGRDRRSLGKRRIIDRHVAEADEGLAFGGDHFPDDLFRMGAQIRVARHENIADAIVTRLRQVYALTRHFLAKEAIWNLHQNARTVAHQRIGADSTTMGEVFQHLQAVFHDHM
ncbi:Uncharacterised protein [Brucella neotomae]|nr:Uncharacterised protein [Brucella neotomae]